MYTIVWPRMFEMEYAPMHDERSVSANPSLLKELYKKFDIKQGAVPIALRWRVHPDLGFPREPFGVFRRIRSTMQEAQSLSVTSGTYSNEIIGWGNYPLIDLFVFLDASLPATGRLEALDEHQEPIYGEYVNLSSSTGIVRFHHPNLCSVRITGSIKIVKLSGLAMNVYASDDRWELIEEVGLPYKYNEVPNQIYDARLQGKPGNLKPGDQAAFDRLTIGLAFSEKPPVITPGGDPAPVWITPDGNDVLDEIRQPGSTLDLITKMLCNVDPNVFLGNQRDYTETISNGGISQEGGASGSDPSKFDIHTGSMFLLGAACDIHPALGLGFGTADFPFSKGRDDQYIEPNRPVSLHFDYMVAVLYKLPFDLELRIAAISSPTLSWPKRPNNLSAVQYQRNRGINLDDPEKEDVKISWARQPKYKSPHGFYIGIREGGGSPFFLNSKRLMGPGYLPVIPASRPDSDMENEANVTYIDTNRIVPYTGSRSNLYEVVAQDVFGRCSDWGTITHSLSPKGPDIPALLEIKFKLDVHNATGRSIPAKLQIDLAWDWEDRGPSVIELAGKFFSPVAPGAAPSGIQYNTGSAFSSLLTVQFDNTLGGGINVTPGLKGAGSLFINLPNKPLENPSVVKRYKILPDGNEGTIQKVPKEPGSEEGMAVRYRVILEGFTLDFTSNSKLYYAVYARASEKVNPSWFSPFSQPVSTTAVDPLPADAPAILPDLRWASLPDGTGIARYKVSFPPVPYATGYLIYEATEAAMRYAANVAEPPPDNELTTRVLQLQVLPFTGDIIDTFSRMTRDPLPSPEIEVSLPGSADGIYAYNFSSVTSENIESARSNTIYVAVPRRLTPGAPSLQVNKGDTEGTVNIKLEAGTGTPPVAMELYRTRSSLLSVDVNKMGTPLIEKTDPLWVKFNIDDDGTPVINPTGPYFTIHDTVNPGWYPYYYRGIAWGPNDPANGIYPGRSKSSPVIDILIPPAGPPDLEPLIVDESTDRSLWKISFRSRAEWRLPPPGPHMLSVQTVDRTSKTVVYTVKSKIELFKIDELTGSPAETDGKVYRHSRDADGRWLYDVYFAKGTDTHVAVVLTDPLERQSVVKARLEAPPDLIDVSFRRFLFWLTIRFKSAVPVTPPSSTNPGYIVETFDADTPTWFLFNRARIHQIGTSGGLGKFQRNVSPDIKGRYYYSITRCIWFRQVMKVAVRITSSSGLLTELTS